MSPTTILNSKMDIRNPAINIPCFFLATVDNFKAKAIETTN